MGAPVAFSRKTSTIGLVSALVLASLVPACNTRKAHSHVVAGGDAERGRAAITKFGCGTCHIIPGIAGANGRVSHPLFGFANRGDIAQAAPNTADNLVRWIRKPTDILPRTKMPELGVSEQEAKDIATYLYTLNGE